ncbi:MAG: hypothetical protein M3P37_04565 [Actinomycetota bacterium]|nr:hypothetical protein [Actinomycetota bacterium]
MYLPEDPQDAWVVACSELLINRGQGITDAAERIAAEVLVAHDQPRLVWIEHHPPETTDGEAETFDLVTFDSFDVQERAPYLGERGVRLGTPRWKPLDRTTGEALVGQTV